MRKRIKSSRRTHAMLRSAGISERNSLPVEMFKGGCCKMFFPMTETSGTTITDVIGGAVFTPDEISWEADHCIQLDSEAKALTSGSFPDFARKDFILFSVYRGIVLSDSIFETGSIRAECTIRLKNAAGEQIGYYDGDGFDLMYPGNTYGLGTESLYGAIPPAKDEYCYAGIGVVRNGSLGGLWLHNSDFGNGGQVDGFSGPYVREGTILSRNFRNSINPTAGPTPGVCKRSDYGVDTKYVDMFQNYTSGSPPPSFSQEFTDNQYSSGIAGMWGDMELTGPLSFGQLTTMSIGMPLTRLVGCNVEYYGIAMFVFENGLPDDFREALRWMRDQWMAGNKVIWPDWVSVS